MPAIDLSKYGQQQKNKKTASTKQENGILAILNKDISFGSKQLGDKKKEALYLEASSLLRAGINLKSSLELMAGEQRKAADKILFADIQRDVISGSPLSAALQRSGKFSLYEIYTLQIGEETGKITEVLTDLAVFYKNRIRQRRKIISSLSYPCIVLATSFGAVFFMLKFIVPMFGDIFKRFGGHLPWITEKLIAISALMQDYFSTFFITILLLTGGIIATRKQIVFRRISSTVLLKTPVVGNLIRKIYLARFCNSMRLLIDAKLPLLRAIALCRQMIAFYPIETSLLIVESEILKGCSLHESLKKFPIYPSKMVQLIKVGEETNQLDQFFGEISDQYIEEVEYKTSTLSSTMEPLIIIFLGLIVGTILVSMYLPLFEMSNSFQ